jgi:hypothetical protein
MEVDWGFWKGYASGAISGIAVFWGGIKGVAELKSFWLDRARPHLLKTEKCAVNTAGVSYFELLINNSGLRDCSLVSIELTWPNGDVATLGYEPSTSLPKTIPAGLTERVIGCGNCTQNIGWGMLTLKFNTKKKPIKEKIKFSTIRLY